MGIIVNGLIMAKNMYVPKNGGEARFTIDVGIPGNRTNMPVSVDNEYYQKVNEFDAFVGMVNLSSFNGNYFFQKA
jgi:hypothetical protein